MKLCLIGHGHRFSVDQAVVGLLGMKAELCDGIPQDWEGDFLVSSLRREYGRITAAAELRWKGRLHTGSERLAVPDHLPADEKVRLEQYALRLAVFKAVREATGEKYPWGSLTGVRPTKIALRMLERGHSPGETENLLVGRYLLEPERAKLAVEAAGYGYRTKRLFNENDISLYIGIPFCPTRCAYCSFVSSDTGRSGHLVEPYLDRLLEELRIKSELIRELSLNVRTIYIGGGTPTTLTVPQLDRLMAEVRRRIDTGLVLEYTVEAGRPDTITGEKLKVLKENGAGRICINPQSMDAEVLRRCSRPHSPEDVRRAYEEARDTGFDCINMDTIAGLPGDSPGSFESTLRELAALGPENITVHTLALKRGADLKTDGIGTGLRPDDVMSMLDFSLDFLYNHGYRPYYLYRQKYMAASLENTGWTLEGRESIYNICIMEEFQTILSLGAGGVTKLVAADGQMIRRIANNKYPKEYIDSGEKIASDCERIRKFYSEWYGTGT
jgi:oxygen-independent coproporphyrinogen-3 oxidase